MQGHLHWQESTLWAACQHIHLLNAQQWLTLSMPDVQDVGGANCLLPHWMGVSMLQRDCQADCCCCQAEDENSAESWCQQPKVLHAIQADWSGPAASIIA